MVDGDGGQLRYLPGVLWCSDKDNAAEKLYVKLKIDGHLGKM